MIVYKCDNCGTEIANMDGGGSTFLRYELIVVRVALVVESDGQEKWVSTGEDEKLHICQRCVFDAARNGVVVRWNPVLRKGETGDPA